jgi:hypothetical protein
LRRGEIAAIDADAKVLATNAATRRGDTCSVERPAFSARSRAHACIRGPITTRSIAAISNTGAQAGEDDHDRLL